MALRTPCQQALPLLTRHAAGLTSGASAVLLSAAAVTSAARHITGWARTSPHPEQRPSPCWEAATLLCTHEAHGRTSCMYGWQEGVLPRRSPSGPAEAAANPSQAGPASGCGEAQGPGGTGATMQFSTSSAAARNPSPSASIPSGPTGGDRSACPLNFPDRSSPNTRASVASSTKYAKGVITLAGMLRVLRDGGGPDVGRTRHAARPFSTASVGDESGAGTGIPQGIDGVGVPPGGRLEAGADTHQSVEEGEGSPPTRAHAHPSSMTSTTEGSTTEVVDVTERMLQDATAVGNVMLKNKINTKPAEGGHSPDAHPTQDGAVSQTPVQQAGDEAPITLSGNMRDSGPKHATSEMPRGSGWD